MEEQMVKVRFVRTEKGDPITEKIIIGNGTLSDPIRVLHPHDEPHEVKLNQIQGYLRTYQLYIDGQGVQAQVPTHLQHISPEGIVARKSPIEQADGPDWVG